MGCPVTAGLPHTVLTASCEPAAVVPLRGPGQSSRMRGQAVQRLLFLSKRSVLFPRGPLRVCGASSRTRRILWRLVVLESGRRAAEAWRSGAARSAVVAQRHGGGFVRPAARALSSAPQRSRPRVSERAPSRPAAAADLFKATRYGACVLRRASPPPAKRSEPVADSPPSASAASTRAPGSSDRLRRGPLLRVSTLEREGRVVTRRRCLSGNDAMLSFTHLHTRTSAKELRYLAGKPVLTLYPRPRHRTILFTTIIRSAGPPPCARGAADLGPPA